MEDHFIEPEKLLSILQSCDNFLIVDIRPVKDFLKTKINPSKGYIINIPESFIIPGSSANALGYRLVSSAKKLWDKRDQFHILILLDKDTIQRNYLGTGLSRLRNIIVKCDIWRRNTHEPVILNGGLKEFVQCYPTRVINAYKLLKQVNPEMYKLQELEKLEYVNRYLGSFSEIKVEARMLEDISPYNRDSKKIVLPEALAPVCNEIDNIKIDTAVEEHQKTTKPSFHGESKHGNTRGNRLIRTKRIRASSLKPSSVDCTVRPVAIIEDGFTGLENSGNICYMNSLLQCLKVIPIIKETYVTSDKYLSYTTRKPPNINNHLAEVLRQLWSGTSSKPRIYFISEFKNRIVEFAPNYNNNTHEDCFEFFLFLFNLVSEDCSTDLPIKVETESEKAWFSHLQGRSSFWIETFYFQFKNVKVCRNCHETHVSFETEGALFLPVPNKNCTLDGLINDYMKESSLVDYPCNNCKSVNTIINRKEVSIEPKVFAVVLKR
ncbi:ubiquitin carboxyl-terminal hydrolase 8-like [Diorhabda sublineata]|uniref:ubiquitin carboxyl-terminal hydrolase 8-like n=1 Tax=Diorhabda sublineata TaxID=1163346 RepID=UPI0024E061E2|nr:ubiquitin carboxyl-terminal hydrolase 8-like [Diorhabda sublineata]